MLLQLTILLDLAKAVTTSDDSAAHLVRDDNSLESAGSRLENTGLTPCYEKMSIALSLEAPLI